MVQAGKQQEMDGPTLPLPNVLSPFYCVWSIMKLNTEANFMSYL